MVDIAVVVAVAVGIAVTVAIDVTIAVAVDIAVVVAVVIAVAVTVDIAMTVAVLHVFCRHFPRIKMSDSTRRKQSAPTIPAWWKAPKKYCSSDF